MYFNIDINDKYMNGYPNAHNGSQWHKQTAVINQIYDYSSFYPFPIPYSYHGSLNIKHYQAVNAKYIRLSLN